MPKLPKTPMNKIKITVLMSLRIQGLFKLSRILKFISELYIKTLITLPPINEPIYMKSLLK